MENEKVKLAIVGTQGLPNQYGGFETLVEYLAKHLSKRFKITVFCSSSVYENKLSELHGCKLIYLPLRANGIQSIVYDIISILKSVKKYDKILILGASGGIILPFLRKYKTKFILNFGGLDWQRSKWGRCTKKFLKLSEKLAVRNSGTLIADNVGIQKYIRHEYKRESLLIEYGGDQVTQEVVDSNDIKKHPFLKQKYALSVARIQPDNNVEIILEVFSQDVSMPVVFIGNWNASSYGNEMRKKYSNRHNIILLDSIYDQKELKSILKLRNYITHDYFRFNTELFYSETGKKRMIKDFVEFRERSKKLDTVLKAYLKIYSDTIGLTDEKIDALLLDFF